RLVVWVDWYWWWDFSDAAADFYALGDDEDSVGGVGALYIGQFDLWLARQHQQHTPTPLVRAADGSGSRGGRRYRFLSGQSPILAGVYQETAGRGLVDCRLQVDLHLTAMKLYAEQIKRQARALGFDKVGIVSATALAAEGERLREWL